MNINALAQQVRDLDIKVRDQEMALRQMIGAIGTLDERLRQAEASLAAQRITNIGRGPTVRN